MDDNGFNQRRPRPRFAISRVVVGLALLGLTLAWPLVEIGPNGDTLIRFTSTHGLDVRDLFSLPLLLAAVVVVWPHRPRHVPAPGKSG